MANILTDLGEEWIITNDLSSASVDVGLFDDSTDSVSDNDDLSDVSTEPSDGNYSRRIGESLSASDISGDWGIDNDDRIVFDLEDTTGTVDSYFFVAYFEASDTGDSSPQDHLVVSGSLSQSYELSSVDKLEISAGTAGVTLS